MKVPFIILSLVEGFGEREMGLKGLCPPFLYGRKSIILKICDYIFFRPARSCQIYPPVAGARIQLNSWTEYSNTEIPNVQKRPCKICRVKTKPSES